MRRKQYSVILLDEIEKAHSDVFNILLQILDDGRLTDNKGRMVDFKNTIIIMTSNIGSHIIQESFSNKNSDNSDLINEKTKIEVFEILKKTIRPEFLNRIDEIIMFKPLDLTQIKEIIRLQFNIAKEMLEISGIDIKIMENAIDFIAKKSYDPQFGARPVKRAIQKFVLNDLAKSVLSEQIDKKHQIVIDVLNDNLIFKN